MFAFVLGYKQGRAAAAALALAFELVRGDCSANNYVTARSFIYCT